MATKLGKRRCEDENAVNIQCRGCCNDDTNNFYFTQLPNPDDVSVEIFYAACALCSKVYEDELFLIDPRSAPTSTQGTTWSPEPAETDDQVCSADSCDCGNANADCYIVCQTKDDFIVTCAVCDKKYMSLRERRNGHTSVGLTPIGSVFELKAADHIILERTFYTHHAIVTGKISGSETHVKVCHFDGPDERLKGTVTEATLQVIGAAPLYRVDYRREACWPAPVVVAMARYHKNNKNYSIIRNNCEHFANFCKTGFHHSSQVDALLKLLKHAGHYALVNVGRQFTERGIQAIRARATSAAAQAAAEAAAKTGWLQRIRSMWGGGAAAGAVRKTGMWRYLTPVASVASTGLMIGYEIWSISSDVRNTHDCRSRGIAGGETGVVGGTYDVSIRKICRNVGSFTGAAVGSLIPIPIMPVVGMTLVGSLVGERVVGALGSKILDRVRSVDSGSLV